VRGEGEPIPWGICPTKKETDSPTPPPKEGRSIESRGGIKLEKGKKKHPPKKGPAKKMKPGGEKKKLTHTEKPSRERETVLQKSCI